MARQIPEKKRLRVEDRANECCEYCYSQMRYSPDRFNIEHIIPVVLGGLDDLDNLALACFGCNRAKHRVIEVRDGLTGRMVMLYHPRRDRWLDHFRWSENLLEIVGITAIGRVTVERLKLNRERVVNLREVLLMVDKHPPSLFKS